MSRVLVPGGYGLIGTALCRALTGAGHQVIVAGRNPQAAQRALPALAYRHCDMAKCQTPEAWHPLLDGVDCVVNCAGALQDGPRDGLDAVHHGAVAALAGAAVAREIRVVQISAAEVHEDADTAFFRSKARGDAVLLASGCECVILRPGLVLA